MKKKTSAPTQRFSHRLVPEHKVVSDNEKKEVLEEYKVQATQLPKIYTTDPALIGLEAKPGDLVRIKRKDVTGENVYYRLVIRE